jgi:hypothetical protein
MFGMNPFEFVTISVSVGGLLASLTSPFRLGAGLAELGRQGSMWFERPEDRSLEERPSEDAIDAPIPRRPLRARF